ncbi:MAG: nuclear transport factor 2 family protein [Sphingomonadales bacterium]|nr:nuclear transport factor 2 family protein [Sphingomonadales bacterium]
MSGDFSDWLAICETKARYCRLMDTKDWAGWADVFTADMVMDGSQCGGQVTRGRDAVVAYVRSCIETAVTTHHVHNPEIRFDAEGAEVIWAMQDRVRMGEDRALGGHKGHTGWGHYFERYTKGADGKWRISHQVLKYLQMDVTTG